MFVMLHVHTGMYVCIHVHMNICALYSIHVASYVRMYICCILHVLIFLQDHLSIDHRYPFGLPGVNVCSLDLFV